MALKANEIGFVENDRLPSLRGTLTEEDGSPVNLNGCTVTLHIKYKEPLIKEAVVTDAVNGVYLIEWLDGDLRAGKWTFEIQVTDSDGKPRTWKREPTTNKLLTMVIDSEIA